MCYELERFRQLTEKRKTEDKLPDGLATSRLCIRVMDEIRIQTGIVFPADDHIRI
jgi:hypothetical protein